MFRALRLPLRPAGVQQLNAQDSAVIHTLAYFSMFQHPLREDELIKYLHFWPMTHQELSSTLNRLLGLGLVERSEAFYYLAGQGPLVRIRRERSALAQPWFRKIRSSVWVLANIPFVEGLALSGSLSKGTQDVAGDIDFLVLCRPGKLWVLQFFFTVFHKLLTPEQKKRFCTNFLLASDHLSTQQRDLFTATEIVFLGPLVNGALWEAFFRKNSWVREFYPNWTPPTLARRKTPRLLASRLLEWAFSGNWGDWFVNAMFNWRSNRRHRKQSPGSCDPPPTRLKSAWKICYFKPTRGLDLRERWQATLEDFESRHNVCLARWSWEGKDFRNQEDSCEYSLSRPRYKDHCVAEVGPLNQPQHGY